MNAHAEPMARAAALGYPAAEGLVTRLSWDDLRDALLDALERSWPSGALPGPRTWHEAGTDPEALATALASDRAAGRLPLLVTACISSVEDAGDRLAAVHAVCARDGAWLHANVSVAPPAVLPRIERADSIFVASRHERMDVFATRHAGVLGDEFAGVLAERGNNAPLG